MHTLSTPLTKEEKHAHNEIAALLSIVPGLGHIYKGHYGMGLFLMFLGMPIAIFVGINIYPWYCRRQSTPPNRLLGSSCV